MVTALCKKNVILLMVMLNSKSLFLVVTHKVIVLMAVVVVLTEGVVLQIACNIKLATKITELQCRLNLIIKTLTKVANYKTILINHLHQMDSKIILQILTSEEALYTRVVDVVVMTLAIAEGAKAIKDSLVVETIKATMEVCKVIAGQVSKALMVNLMVTPIKIIFHKTWMARSHLSYHRTEAIIRLNYVNTSNKATVLTKTNVHLLMVNKN
jgi:hypothetical protein